MMLEGKLKAVQAAWEKKARNQMTHWKVNDFDEYFDLVVRAFPALEPAMRALYSFTRANKRTEDFGLLDMLKRPIKAKLLRAMSIALAPGSIAKFDRSSFTTNEKADESFGTYTYHLEFDGEGIVIGALTAVEGEGEVLISGEWKVSMIDHKNLKLLPLTEEVEARPSFVFVADFSEWMPDFDQLRKFHKEGLDVVECFDWFGTYIPGPTMSSADKKRLASRGFSEASSISAQDIEETEVLLYHPKTQQFVKMNKAASWEIHGYVQVSPMDR